MMTVMRRFRQAHPVAWDMALSTPFLIAGILLGALGNWVWFALAVVAAVALAARYLYDKRKGQPWF